MRGGRAGADSALSGRRGGVGGGMGVGAAAWHSAVLSCCAQKGCPVLLAPAAAGVGRSGDRRQLLCRRRSSSAQLEAGASSAAAAGSAAASSAAASGAGAASNSAAAAAGASAATAGFSAWGTGISSNSTRLRLLSSLGSKLWPVAGSILPHCRQEGGQGQGGAIIRVTSDVAACQARAAGSTRSAAGLAELTAGAMLPAGPFSCPHLQHAAGTLAHGDAPTRLTAQRMLPRKLQDSLCVAAPTLQDSLCVAAPTSQLHPPG